MTKPHFVWHDLNTTDRAAAQRFYGELFNWKFDGDDYAHIKAGEQLIGGIRTIGPNEHMPPNWLGYIGVDDVAATVDKMTKAGGKLLMPTRTMPNVGTFAILSDPTGGIMAPWRSARPEEDREPQGRPAMFTFCWDELSTIDLEAATAFYAASLGWKPQTADMGGGMEYTLFKRPGDPDPTMPNEDRNAGGAMTAQPGQSYSYWLSYVAVPNADETVAHVKRLGGTVMVEPMDIPNVGRFAVFSDPQKATLAVLQPAM